jgi:predicted nucleotidyltransferase
MRETILNRLRKFELDNNVEVILAVESGSRGWGFASEDSDYDVRFVYKHPVDRYLDLHPPNMSHDWIDGECDYEGFDIHKFYDLLLKSNMNIIDWVMQDVIYIDRIKEKDGLKQYVSTYFDRRTYAAHNLGLCKKNYHKYFISNVMNEPTAKRYVYCIRAILSAEYCSFNNRLAPIKFNDLITAMFKEYEINEIREILEVKKKTNEKEAYNNKKWHDWISSRMDTPLIVESQSEANRKLYYDLLNSHMKMQMRESV